jgi:hypothetical protein
MTLAVSRERGGSTTTAGALDIGLLVMRDPTKARQAD